MTLDPQIAEMLAAEASGEGPSFAIGVEQSRAAEYDFIELCGPLIEMRVEDRDVPGPDGAVPVRVYTPGGGNEERPAVVYFHGGGWVAGDLETMDRVCRNMADGAAAVVVSAASSTTGCR